MKESAFWSSVKKALDENDMHLSRVENSAGSGMSDVSACCNGKEVWIELKVFVGNRLHFRNSQFIWITKRLSVGGRVVVLTRKDDKLGAHVSVYSAKDVLALDRIPGGDEKSFWLDPSSLLPIIKTSKPFKWQDVRRAIFNF